MQQNEKLILCADPKAQNDSYKAEIETAIKNVIESGYYILGNCVKEFEREFAEYIGVKHAVGVANGTDALCLAMRAVGVKPEDEVITVSHSAVATVAAIEQIGAVPVFCDIEPETLCLDPEKIASLVTSKTKAVIAVHIYGQPAKIDLIKIECQKYNLKLIEDCAQAHGAEFKGKKAGSIGDVSAFSFYPTKNLGAIGDGGAVLTNSDETCEKLMSLRQYGWKERYISSVAGINSRLDELQAGILSVKLKYLSGDNQKRRLIAQKYNHILKDTKISPPNEVADTLHAMHLYVIKTDSRNELHKHMMDRKISCGIHYPMAIHEQPAYANRIRGCDKLYETEKLYKAILSLPMYPELSDAHLNRIEQALAEFN